MRVFRVLASLLCLALLGVPMGASADDWAFPPRYDGTTGNNTLYLIGSATFQRNFVPFYAGALYAPVSVRTAKQVMSGLSPCRIRLIMAIPQMDKTAVQDYWMKALQAAAGPENFARVRTQAEHLVQSLPAATRGQNLLFDYNPDAGMRVLVDDQQVAQLAGVEFNRTLLAVWFGPGAQPEFRTGLTAGFKQK